MEFLSLSTSGSSYLFLIYPIDTVFNRVSGVYVFLILPPEVSQFSLLYIGITNDFRARLGRHHRMDAALGLGMTHVGILRVRAGRNRKRIERDFLRSFNPVFNQTWLRDFVLG